MITCSDDLVLSIIKQTICDLDTEHNMEKVTRLYEILLINLNSCGVLLLFGSVGRYVVVCLLLGFFFSNQFVDSITH